MSEKTLSKPKASSDFAQKELDKAEAQFEKFDESVKSMTLDRMNEAPVIESESQTKLSTREQQASDGIWLKPSRTLSSREKFNENYRSEYNHAKEYVPFIAEHREIIGEKIEIWTKPFAGVPAEYWEIPSNKKVYGPRYLANQLCRAKYHRLKMNQNVQIGTNQFGTDFGQLAVDQTVERITARPVTEKKTVFMAGNF